MEVLGHYDITHNNEPISLAHPFKFKEKYVAGFESAQIGTALVTTASDEVQVARSVIALQICWHLFRVALS